MKILITGGAGYIGTELTYRLAENAAVEKVIIYDNLNRANYNLFIGVKKMPESKVEFVVGDLLDSRKLKKILKEVDAVFHLAARVTTPFADQNPHLFEQVNHWGTAELVYAVEESDVKKFIYLSSASVYGAGKDEIDINTPLTPRTFYGISKMRGEKHVQRLMEKIPAYIIRCGNVYGYSKSMRFEAVINKFMFEANFTGRVSVQGDGKQSRAFIHINNTINALENILNEPIESGIYNLVKRNISIETLTNHLMEVYPELDLLFIDQHLKMRTITVKPDERIAPLMNDDDKGLTEELMEFKKGFTFCS